MQESGPNLLFIFGIAGGLVLSAVFVFSILLLKRMKD
ncbi:MAG: hypothetical protein PWP23_3159 [Candidatus Sumerlaeota bacterium]|nr:hypothetical protein [Candidatus Sumerlaeota bacterium]